MSVDSVPYRTARGRGWVLYGCTLALSLLLMASPVAHSEDEEDGGSDEAEDIVEQEIEDSAEASAEEEAEEAAESAAEEAAEESAEDEAERAAEEGMEDAAEEDAEEEAGDEAENETEEEADEGEESESEDLADTLDRRRSRDSVEYLVESDTGELIVRNELVALTDSDRIDRFAALPELALIERHRLTALEVTFARFLVRSGSDLSALRDRLRRRFPDAAIDFNHGYEFSEDSGSATNGLSNMAGKIFDGQRLALNEPHAVGMIDSAVDADHDSLRHAAVTQRSFLSDNRRADRRHGTAVASLLVGRSTGMAGMVPEARLYSASVFAAHPERGLRATTDSLVEALGWLAEQDVRVINISLSGPANATVENAINLLVGRRVMIVAAVGNDGPLSDPRYPAAYADVIAVTAIHSDGRVYRRAGRGAHLDYAAPGVDLVAAAAETGTAYDRLTGTSFAAPVVTGLVLYYLDRTGADVSPETLIQRMNADLIDLGDAGADTVFGRGVPGRSLMGPGQLLQR